MGIEALKGKTLASVVNEGYEVLFTTTEPRKYRMYHAQECCEHVQLEDVCGDLNDLIGTPILEAEESSRVAEADEDESGTWTFYKLSTIKGTVTLRWLGESNGFYSESVDFEEITNDN